MTDGPEPFDGAESDGHSPATGIDRRRFMSVAGATGLVGAAGFGSSALTSTAAADAAGSADTFVSWTGIRPQYAQFNEYNHNSFAEYAADVVFDRFARYDHASDEFHPSLLTEWTFDGDSLTLEIRDGATWHDGDPVTSLDVAMLFDLDRHAGLEPIVTEVETDGDRRAILRLEGTTNREIVEHRVLRRRLTTKHTEYRDFLAKGDAGADELRSYAPLEPVGNGPFEFSDRDGDRIVLDAFDGHPRAEDVGFSTYEFRHVSGADRAVTSLVDGDIDAAAWKSTANRVPVDRRDDFAEAALPATWGLALAFDHEDDHLGRRAVRQAMMHVIDTEAVAEAVTTGPRRPVSIPCGVRPRDVESVLGDARSSFATYDSEDAAVSLLREAGYSREGGVWADGSGDPITVPIKTAGGWSDWMTATEVIVEQLSAFGFDATFEPTDEFLTDVMDGDYTAVTEAWVPRQVEASITHRALETQIDPRYTRSYSYPAGEVTVPSRQGSGTDTVDVRGRLDELASTANAKEATAIAREVAWAINQDLPMLPITVRPDAVSVSTKRVDVPPAGDDAYQVRWPLSWLARTGKLEPTGGGSDQETRTATRTATATPTATEPTETDAPGGNESTTSTPAATATASPAENRTTATQTATNASATATATENATATETEDDSDGLSIVDLLDALF